MLYISYRGFLYHSENKCISSFVLNYILFTPGWLALWQSLAESHNSSPPAGTRVLHQHAQPLSYGGPRQRNAHGYSEADKAKLTNTCVSIHTGGLIRQ